MRKSRAISLSALVTLASAHALAADGWGASWSFGPVRPTATNHITYVKTVLVPGRIPTLNNVGPLFIWPGISNPTSDLVQTSMNAYKDNGNTSYCKATTSQWCVEASVFGSFGQRNGPAVAIDPDDHVTIEYKLGSDNNTWTQTVTSQKLGKVVSTLTSTSGLMLGGGLGFATEAQNDSFTIDTQYYLCTEVHLAAADPQFGSTGVGATGAQHGATGTGSGPGSAKNLRTPDGGLTWLIDLITLPAMNPQGTQTPAPAINCGASGTGGSSATGGASATGGTKSTGGTTATGGARTGGAPSTGGSLAATGGSAATGGAFASGGKSATGGVAAMGGIPGVGGTPATGGRANTGGSVATTPGSGGTLGTGGSSSAVTQTGGKSNTAQPTGGAAAPGGNGGAIGGSSEANAGTQSSLAGNSGVIQNGTSDSGGCSCNVPGKRAPHRLLAIAIAAVIGLRLRRRR